MYQVSSTCVLPLVSLRSEEVILKDISCSNKVIVMQMMLDACVPSFISMRGTVSELRMPVVVMEMIGIPCFISMCAAVSKCEE